MRALALKRQGVTSGRDFCFWPMSALASVCRHFPRVFKGIVAGKHHVGLSGFYHTKRAAVTKIYKRLVEKTDVQLYNERILFVP